MLSRPIVLTIAGFDPSGCAGVLADIKTFEANGVYGMAVCTANTEQNVRQFEKPNWVPENEIIDQLKLLQEERQFDYVKVGLIESFELLNDLADILLEKNPDTKIVWDPVCKATAEYDFHRAADENMLMQLCRKVYLITPNADEIKILVPSLSEKNGAKKLSEYCHVLLKDGHGTGEYATDVLFSNKHVVQLEGERHKNYAKRGTGCVLSAAITANISKGYDLEPACKMAKDYVAGFITSNETLIGFHKYADKQVAVYNR
jgi:hydroxymethylpyrimidine/phosphomethylpyrimidine kinase